MLFLRPKQYIMLFSHLQNTEDVRVGGSDEIVKEVVGKAGHYVDHKARLKEK